MLYNGTQLEAPFSATSRYSHYESGLSSTTTVTATVDPNGNWIMIACNDLSGVGVIQYYIAEKGFNNIYMATYAPGPNSPSPGEMRFITYTNHTVLTNAPAPSNLTGNTGAIESTDVVGFADGTTASKYYGEYRAIDAQSYGLTGGGFGVFMDIGDRETSSGGPFYKDIDFQTTSSQSTELYNYMFSGHSQTEAFRPGLQGPYALEFTTGGAPAAVDYSFIAGLNLMGYVGASGRGTLTGTASGVPSGHQVTVALSNTTAQYWATPDSTTGAYTISGMKPGTYVETLYQDELAIGTQTVTITAGTTTTVNIADTLFSPPEVFLIGTWDGTPEGFLNADKIQDMHPSDSRMSPWGTFTDSSDTTAMTNYIVGTSAEDVWPMAEWKEATTDTSEPIDNINQITFTLTAAQVVASTLRIGITRAGDGGRPIISVNGGSYSSAPAISTQPSTRGVTVGNWRGNNVTYAYSISASALHVGTNTIDIEVASGSSDSDPWLGPWIIYDAIDLVATANMTSAPKATTVVVSPSNPTVPWGGQQAFVAIVKDQFGNPLPVSLGAFTWSTTPTTLGTVYGGGLYIAGTTSGSVTVTASYFDAANNATKMASTNVIVDAAPTVATAASASPNPVNGITTNLSVLGADDGGESSLTYTWATIGSPPASVGFSANGTNAAKNTTATFSEAGTYSFQATVTDAYNLSTTSSISVTVNQTLTSIAVSPGTVGLTSGQTQLFVAAALDQFGNPLTVQPALIWSLDSGSVGSINAGGLFTAPLSPVGPATVRATSGAVSGSAAVMVAYLKGDLNIDGHLDTADFVTMLGALANISGYQNGRNLSNQDLLAIADIDGDNHVTNADLQALLNLLISGGGSGSASGSASGSGSLEADTVIVGGGASSDNSTGDSTIPDSSTGDSGENVAGGTGAGGQINTASTDELTPEAHTLADQTVEEPSVVSNVVAIAVMEFAAPTMTISAPGGDISDSIASGIVASSSDISDSFISSGIVSSSVAAGSAFSSNAVLVPSFSGGAESRRLDSETLDVPSEFHWGDSQPYAAASGSDGVNQKTFSATAALDRTNLAAVEQLYESFDQQATLLRQARPSRQASAHAEHDLLDDFWLEPLLDSSQLELHFES
jgi:rhamnogalacturonan endolyase